MEDATLILAPDLPVSRAGSGPEVEGRIDSYHLLEKLGEGGFGIVWRALQVEPIHREVALKLVKLDMGSGQVLERFHLERQALANMQHPHIAALLDAGATPDGRPYFVMELVHGEPIHSFCERLILPLAERLALFEKVCLAVQHAHQKGIIHRDLKPGNILVAEHKEAPVPKIIDFGIAKAISHETGEDTMQLTQHDVLVGTPHYMAPEQLEGLLDIDTRADIYALGVVLYQLITGYLPIETTGQSGYALVDRLRATQPLRPSARLSTESQKRPQHSTTTTHLPRGTLPADLDWITMCALEKERHRRYASAAELAADVQRFLKNQPILARPPSVVYLTTKWIRRHSGLFITACLGVLALLTGTALALWQAREAKAAQHEAETQRAVAIAETEKAKTAELSASRESARQQKTASFLTSLVTNAVKQASVGRNAEALKLGLQETLPELKNIKEDPKLHVDMLSQLAELSLRMGDGHQSLDLRLEKVDALYLRQGRDHADTRAALLDYLTQLTTQQKFESAQTLLHFEKQHVEKVEGRATPFWLSLQKELVRSLGESGQDTAAFAEAETLLNEARKPVVSKADRYMGMFTYALRARQTQHYEEAEKVLKELETIVQDDPELAHLSENLDSLLLGHYEQRSQHEAALRVITRMLKNTQARSPTESSSFWGLQLKLSEHSAAIGRQEAAIDFALQAKQSLLTAAVKGPDTYRLELCIVLNQLSALMGKAGKHKQAQAEAKLSMETAKAMGQASFILSSYETLSQSYLLEGQITESIRLLHEALTISGASPEEHMRVYLILCETQQKSLQLEAALETAEVLWSKCSAAVERPSFVAYRRRTAQLALQVWEQLQKGQPQHPAPKQLSIWKEAAKK